MKKKILFVLAHLNVNGGVARTLVSLCNNLDLEKYDISILPLYRIDKEMLDVLDSRIEVKKGFGIYFKGFSHILHMIPKSWLYRYLVKENYDIEVAFQTDIPTLMIGASTNKSAVHVFWMHGYHLWKESYLTGDRVYCVSKCNAERCRQEMDSDVPVDYCYNLTDDAKIVSLSREGVELPDVNCVKLVTVGRLSPEKGYVRLVNILRQLRDEGFAFRLLIVGDGPEREQLEHTVVANNMQDWIILVGRQLNPHKFTVWGDVFVCSSFAEGYSTACTEAAILGIPIITTNVPGGREIIEDCECGLLTEIDDDSLKNAIKEVLLNPKVLKSWRETMVITSDKFKLHSRLQKVKIIFEELSELSDKKSFIR